MAAFWPIGKSQIIRIVSYPIRKKSRFWLFSMWSVKEMYHALLPKTDYRDKGRGHDRRLHEGLKRNLQIIFRCELLPLDTISHRKRLVFRNFYAFWKRMVDGYHFLRFANILRMIYSLRSMAVFSGRSAVAPISSPFLCPRPPLLLCVQNQNRRAT